MASGPSFSQEHCKVITVSFAIGPLVKHYGRWNSTASTQHNGNRVPFLHGFHLANVKKLQSLFEYGRLRIVPGSENG